MSIYTIELRYLVENKYPLFDFDYPLFNAEYKPVLEKKIIDRYFFREIGFETPGRFKHFLRMRLNEIMPYYNQMYHSETFLKKEGFNPFYNLDTTETQTRKVKQDSKTETKNNSNATALVKGKEVQQDTPRSGLTNKNYASNIVDNDQNTTGTTTDNGLQSGLVNTTEDFVVRTLGSGGLRYPADVILEYRKALINVDVQIIDELSDLFMSIY